MHYEFLYQKLQKFDTTFPDGVHYFFVLNSVNLSEEKEKLLRTTCASLNYATMKGTLKKVFSDISSLEHKNVPAVKEEVEMINFNHYRNSKEKNLIDEAIK